MIQYSILEIIKKGGTVGNRKRYSAEEIINKLYEAEVLLSKVETSADVVRQLGASEMTIFPMKRHNVEMKWMGGMRLRQRIANMTSLLFLGVIVKQPLFS